MTKYFFTSWSGDVSGNTNPASFEMPAQDINIVANFATNKRKLNFSSTPVPVSITITVGTQVVTLGSGQSIDVNEGETVSIQAPASVVG